MNFPMRAIYRRRTNGIQLITAFKDGEEVMFDDIAERPSATAAGNAYYRSCANPNHRNLINVKHLVEMVDEYCEECEGYGSDACVECARRDC